MKFDRASIKAVCLIASLDLCIIEANSLGNWTQIVTSGAFVSTRSGISSAFFPQTREFLVMGGTSSNSYLSDFFSFSISGKSNVSSTRISPDALSTSGGLTGAAVASDPSNGLFYIAGGRFGGTPNRVQGNLWSFNVTSRLWTALPITGFNSASRESHCMVWDAANNRLLLSGGVPRGSASQSDFWSFSVNGAGWSQFAQSMPVARSSHACTINDQTGSYYVHGGAVTAQRDLQVFNFTSMRWALLDLGSTAVQLFGHQMFHHSRQQVLLIFFGYNSFTGSSSSEIFQYDLVANQNWTRVNTGGNTFPSRRFYVGSGFNPHSDEFFFFGGTDGTNENNEFWTFTLTPRNNPSIVSTVPFTSTTTATVTPMIMAGNASSISTTRANVNYPDSSLSLLSLSETFTPECQNATTVSHTATLTHKTAARTTILVNIGSSSGVSSFVFFTIAGFGVTPVILYVAVGALLFILITIAVLVYKRQSRHKNQNNSSTVNVGKESNYKKIKLNVEKNERETSELAEDGGAATAMLISPDYATKMRDRMGLSVPVYLECALNEDFKIANQLSEGGYGIVYLAETKSDEFKKHGKFVVVKASKTVVDETSKAIFFQEVGITAFFSDRKNIAKLIGFTQNPYSMVMKYYALGSLRGWLRNETKRPEKVIMSFMKDIAAGLKDLHSKGVLHCDIKPENILLDKSDTGIPVLAISDFGISQVITDTILKVTDFKIAVQFGLSLHYTPPEKLPSQYEKQRRLFSLEEQLSSDVYSYGVVLYELFSSSHIPVPAS